MEKQNDGLSRRRFLQGGALLTGGILAGSSLMACSSSGEEGSTETSETSESWDEEADIVVVGTGTVAVAAMAASYYGAGKIVVCEKMDTFGGTTIYSGQGMGIPLNHVHGDYSANDSLDEVLKYYKAASGGRADLEVGESYATNGDKFVSWLEDAYGMTFTYTMGTELVYGDYYEPCEGYLAVGRNPIVVDTIEGEADGTTLWSFFSKSLDADENVELMFGTPATELITDSTGAVIGVVANDGKNDIRIKANKAVILGTGGFEHDADMRKKYLPAPLVALCSNSGNTGDGQKMGMKIGADVANMDRVWGLPHEYLGETDPWELIENNEVVNSLTGSEASQDSGQVRGLPGSVIVNAKGRRIGNESSSYSTFNCSFGNFDSGENTQPSLVSYLVFDSTYVAPWGLPGIDADGNLPDAYVTADTLEELAEKLGIDQEGFIDEMTEFNANAAEGVDPVFHRGEREFDVNTAGYYSAAAGTDTLTSNPVLSPVATPPFYAVPMVPGTFGTSGGLVIDANAQVKNVDGEVIPGLYAVGNCSCGVAGGIYAHGGMTVGSGAVMSWVAVRHALGIED